MILTYTFSVRVWLLFVELIVCLRFYQVLLIQAMVNAAGILSIRAEDTDLDENVKRRVSQHIMYKKLCAQTFLRIDNKEKPLLGHCRWKCWSVAKGTELFKILFFFKLGPDLFKYFQASKVSQNVSPASMTKTKLIATDAIYVWLSWQQI